MAQKRLQKELSEFMTGNPLPWAKVNLRGDDLYKWQVTLQGPESSPYEKGVFNIDIDIPIEYPFKPPKLQFTTKIYHPNVKSDGQICTNILTQDWSPQLKITQVLMTIRQLMSEPVPDHALEPEIANVYKTDINKFNNTAKEWTKKYATNKA